VEAGQLRRWTNIITPFQTAVLPFGAIPCKWWCKAGRIEIRRGGDEVFKPNLIGIQRLYRFRNNPIMNHELIRHQAHA
jgi:hypothetical protein